MGGQLIHGIGEKAFYAGDYTTAMREAVIPDSITEIPELAFAGDFALETVVLHKGITQIGLQAFCDNPRLEKIIFWGTLEEWEAIEKCSPWVSSDTDIVLVCTDGTKTIED